MHDNLKLVPVTDADNAVEFMMDIVNSLVTLAQKGIMNDDVETNIVDALCKIPGLKRHDCLVLLQGTFYTLFLLLLFLHSLLLLFIILFSNSMVQV